MDTRTTNTNAPASQQQRTERTAAYREKFRPYFEKMGVRLTSFMPKMIFHRGINSVIALYKSEIERPEGFYTVIVGPDFMPKDGDDKLYHVPFNPHWKMDYEEIESEKYVVPSSALQVVNVQAYLSKVDLNNNNPVKPVAAGLDEPVTNMTIRDVAALMWRRPVSNKPWINDLINNNPK